MSRVRYFGNKAQGSVYFTNNTFVDGETITIDDKVYEFDDDAAVTAGHVLVDIKGTAALTAAEFLAKVNANKPTHPVTAVVDSKDNLMVHLIADKAGVAGNVALAETVTDAGLVISGATLVGGENAGTQTIARGLYTVTAKDITADHLIIETGLVSPRFFHVETRTAAGLIKDATFLATIVDSKIAIDFAGATDPIAGDTIRWEAFE